MWDANHYLQFGDERTRPASDLASRIEVENPATVIDIGCGPGNSTEVLRFRWPNARVNRCGIRRDALRQRKGRGGCLDDVKPRTLLLTPRGMAPEADARESSERGYTRKPRER